MSGSEAKEEGARLRARVEYLEDRLRKATIDGVSGLFVPNERHYQLHWLVARALERPEVMSVAQGLIPGSVITSMIQQEPDTRLVEFDGSGLKDVNDAEGHDAGDLVIRAYANGVRRILDLLGCPQRTNFDSPWHLSSANRKGGDELSAIITGCRRDEIQQAIAQVLRELLDAEVEGLSSDFRAEMNAGSMSLLPSIWYWGEFRKRIKADRGFVFTDRDQLSLIRMIWEIFADQRMYRSKWKNRMLQFLETWDPADPDLGGEAFQRLMRGGPRRALNGIEDEIIRDTARYYYSAKHGGAPDWRRLVDKRINTLLIGRIEEEIDRQSRKSSSTSQTVATHAAMKIFVLEHVHQLPTRDTDFATASMRR